MDTELLRTFLEVRTTRHFGRAAENLFITQAAVSARIKQLEELLGVTLFLRNRNNIQLTSEGERLLPHAETVMAAVARARQEVILEDSGSSQIYLGVRTGIWAGALQRKLLSLAKPLPDLVLRVDSQEPEALVRSLLDRTLDIAILYEPPKLPELRSQPIGELTLRLYASVPRETVQGAMAGNYVYLDWGGGFARFHARHFGELPVPALRTNMNELAIEYLVAKGGACFLPMGLRKTLAAAGLTPVKGAPEFRRQLNMTYHQGSQQRELIERIARFFSGLKV